MSEQVLSTVQVLGALLPATGLLALLIYARCRAAGCSARRTAVTIGTVCAAVLVSAAALLVAREALSGGLFDLGLRVGEDGQPHLQMSDVRARPWAARSAAAHTSERASKRCSAAYAPAHTRYSLSRHVNCV